MKAKIYVDEIRAREHLVATIYQTGKIDELVIYFRNLMKKRYQGVIISYYEGIDHFSVKCLQGHHSEDVEVRSVSYIFPQDVWEAFKVLTNPNIHICSKCSDKSAICTRIFDPSGRRYIWKHECIECGHVEEYLEKAKQPSKNCPICERPYDNKILTLWDIDWERAFANACEEMHRLGKDEIRYPEGGYTLDSYPVRGFIKLEPEKKCENCGSIGVYHGKGLETGQVYLSVWAYYCHDCMKVTRDYSYYPYFDSYHPERFLPVMKNKIIRGLRDSSCHEHGVCPVCGSKCYSFMTAFHDDTTFDYDYRWIVCSNPKCDWPGVHEDIS